MQPPAPTRVETYPSIPHAEARLAQLGARIHPNKSSHARYLYQIPQGWIAAERHAGQIRLSFYGTCPC